MARFPCTPRSWFGVWPIMAGAAAIGILAAPVPGAERVAKGADLRQEVRLQPDVAKALSRMNEGEFLRIIIRLKDQFSVERRRATMAGARDIRSRAAQRKALTTAMRAHAVRTQAPLLERLKELEATGLVKNLKRLWISNVICAETRAEGVKQIVRFDEVEYVKADIRRPALQQTPAWSVAHINADDVWTTSGITGDGVIVAVLDSGLDLDHPDLVNRLWINAGEDNGDGLFTAADNNLVDDDGNGYIDDVVGWDIVNTDNTPDDWHGHGTHVAGSVAGDGTGGTATGVAPGARIMVLAYSGDPTAGQAESWEGMQYALDNGAHIVNFSSAWKDSWSPDYQTWRDNTEVLADAGVLFVAASGNDNPHVAAPGDVLTPARAPRALAVGATDNVDAIATFSGQGPISWQGVTGYDDYIHPPGLLKPDVTAPGVAVNSTNNGGGYINGAIWSGTSMAAPHAAGAAALLLEEDPTLLPHELMYQLRETAIDLGAGGPDNVFGFGRIDADAAVDHTYVNSPVYDLSVTGTSGVWTTLDIWVDNNDDGVPDNPVANTDNHLYARIRNIGGQAVGNVEIKFYYADVGTLGISGFDPNNDGDPGDGNFNYVDSYFVPVIGPSGSAQDTAVGVVNWNVPVPTTDHWCVGIGVVAPNPPNATEVNRSNNVAFRNFFNIIVTYSQVYAFDFFVYPHPQRPQQPFDLEFVRRQLPRQFEVELAIDRELAERWLRETPGFERVKQMGLKNLPEYDEAFRERGEKQVDYVRLARDRGVLRGIASPDGRPVRVTALVRAPTRGQARALKDLPRQLLVINAANEKGIFGGLTLNMQLDRGEQDGAMASQNRRLYRILVDDHIEAALIEQQLGVEAKLLRGNAFFYLGDDATNRRLRGLGYEPVVTDEAEIAFRVVRVRGGPGEGALREVGARLLLREEGTWIVRASAAQLKQLTRLDYQIQNMGRREPRPRAVQVLVPRKSDIAKVAPHLCDIFNSDPTRQGVVVFGQAWDDGIDELKSLGFRVDIKKTKEN